MARTDFLWTRTKSSNHDKHLTGLTKATTSCKRTWDTVPYFGLNGLPMILFLLYPPPLIKVACNTRPCSKLGGTTQNGGEEGGECYIYRRVTSSELNWERSVFSGSVSTYLQLVVTRPQSVCINLTRLYFWPNGFLRLMAKNDPFEGDICSRLINWFCSCAV